ncbi:MAG: energy transducer TonB [Sphingomicrobium sp.]
MAYRAADNPDRMKALGGVAVVHIALAALILSGLSVHTASQTVERLKTFDILEPPPPPPPPPSPRQTPERAKDKAGAAAKKALPTPVVAPPPKLVIPDKPPVTAARIAATGSAATAGAVNAGSGTGAGGSGNGLGGGGNGDFSGFTPAQRISRIPNREYRHLVAASGRPTGNVGLTLKVNTDGAPSNCRIVRSSGDRSVDSLMCDLALQYVRFRPARDSRGRPVAQDITWYPDWSPNF